MGTKPNAGSMAPKDVMFEIGMSEWDAFKELGSEETRPKDGLDILIADTRIRNTLTDTKIYKR